MKKTKQLFMFVGLMTIFISSTFVTSSASADEVEDLKKQVEALQMKVKKLEARKGSENSFPRGPQFQLDPFKEIERVQAQMDQLFQGSFNQQNGQLGIFSSNMSVTYDLNFEEINNGYQITLDTTGMDKDKIDIHLNENSITVKGEYSRQETQESENQHFSSQSYGSFMKTIPLPPDADVANMKTEKQDDKLVITIPKEE